MPVFERSVSSVSKDHFVAWLDAVRVADGCNVTPGALAASTAWSYRDGSVRHASGRFFQLVGLSWKEGGEQHWQPFIDQREVGTLGIIARHRDGETELLLQAKSEPGNVGVAQLAPTCQATASNRDRVHGGSAPPYSGYFSNTSAEVVSSSLQSEEGTRFLGKRNQNVLVLDNDADVRDDLHRWVPFDVFRELLTEDFLVNTDARSVLCTTNWQRLVGRPLFPGDDEFSRALRHSLTSPVRANVLAQTAALLERLRAHGSQVELCALAGMPGWRFDPADPNTITDGRMSARHIVVQSQTREVSSWDQPILDNHFEQTIELDCGRGDGILQFGFSARWEPGLHDGAELGPTRIDDSETGSAAGSVRLSVRQSNEGGRFFQDVTNYRILDIGEVRPAHDVAWLSLAEVQALLPRGWFNNEARSTLSMLLSLA